MKSFKIAIYATYIVLQSLILTACGSGGSSAANPSNIDNTSQHSETSKFAYINNYNPSSKTNTLSICQIESGVIDGCKPHNIKVSGQVQLFNLNSHAAFGQESKIVYCKVDKTNGSFLDCDQVDTGETTFNHDVEVIGTIGNFMYIIDGPLSDSPIIYVCKVTEAADSLNCNKVSNDLEHAVFMSIDKHHSRAYIVSDYAKDAQIYVCKISPSDGTLNNCQIAIDNKDSRYFNYPWGELAAPFGRFMYIVSTGSDPKSSTVSVCSIDSKTGKFTICRHTGSGFSYSYSLAYDPTGKYILVTNSDSNMNNISSCKRDITTGGLSDCKYTGFNLSSPTWISTSE